MFFSVAKWVGREIIAQNVIHILDAKMVIVVDLGSVTVNQAGEEYYVTNVCRLSFFVNILLNSIFAELNYCDENPNTCENDGKCTSLIKDDGHFRCECPSGYRGKKCEILPPMMTSTTTTTTTVEPDTMNPLDADEDQDDIDNEA